MDFAAARDTMIESQVRTNDVSDLALQGAMRVVERETFVVAEKRAFAYAEVTSPTPSGRWLWKPRDFSKLAQAANVMAGVRVLVIGGAGGYSAAVFAALGCTVTILDDLAHMREQCRWFGGMVGNHVADIVSRYGDSSSVPAALTDYIKGRQGYDYKQHGQAGNTHTTFVPDAIVDRFCILGKVDEHLKRLNELQEIGVDQFSIYLQHDGKQETLDAYGKHILPEIAARSQASK